MSNAPIALDDSKTLDVVAMGAAIVDILGFVDDGFLETHDVPKAGMMLVTSDRADAIHTDMRRVASSAPREISGGSAANTAAGLASLGAKTAFAGKTKDDTLGALFAADIRRMGVAFDTRPFGPDAEGATARSMILVTPDAQRSMCTDLGVSGLLGEEDLPREALASTKITYLEGYMWDRDATKEALRAAAAATKAAGGKIALTLSDTFCVDRHRDSFKNLIAADVDILFANEAEILSLFETEDFESALAQASEMSAVTVVTRSEKGAVGVANGQRAAAAAAPIQKLIDTTGAGDLFAAGFLYGVIENRDLQTCLSFGCLTASEIIQHIGARPEADLKALVATAQ